MSAWYYVDQHRQTVAPLPQDRLISLLSGMARPGEVFVWCAGFDAWKRAAEVEQLFPPPKVAQPLPPVPQVQSELTRAAARQHDAKSARAANTAWAKETLQGIGAFLLMLAIGIGSVTLLMMLLYGATWASENLLHYVSLAAQWAIVVCIVILAPLSAFRKTRVVSAIGFFSSSYIFGTCLWMIGLLTAYFYWGLKSIIIGMCMFGVGLVPVALLASLFNSDWTALSMMLIGVVLTYGARMLAFWMFENV
ncbi:DUF4339 domain-containing protein [Bradyrhizobium diazoefficiens]|uniref:DUF4339 domain-containing protein n=1 Tax=Bradyrhizobium diazoefficiens TaxID=1355477 RepID=UPI00190C24A4|nr:DUF4339 domain-containing protein [Bradyrhizobium diazoefficiens]MBK3665052.1 DUF4339 domain-containing protein [Bradyrhizobium diazoefficiens]